MILIGRFDMPPIDHLHIIREIYESNLTMEGLLEKAKGWANDLGVRKFFIDPKEEDLIAWLRRRRVFAVASSDNEKMAISLIRKRQESQNQCTATTKEERLLHPGGMTVAKECPEIAKEFQKFHIQGQTKGGIFRDRPVDADNYALTALHYLVLGVANERTPSTRWI